MPLLRTRSKNSAALDGIGTRCPPKALQRGFATADLTAADDSTMKVARSATKHPPTLAFVQNIERKNVIPNPLTSIRCFGRKSLCRYDFNLARRVNLDLQPLLLAEERDHPRH